MVSRRSWVEQIMGLPISVLARGEEAGSESADVAVRKVFAELIEVDRVFSPYKADSAVSLLARGGVGWDRVDPVVREVAERCVAARELTGGLFDAEVPGGTWDPSGLVRGGRSSGRVSGCGRWPTWTGASMPAVTCSWSVRAPSRSRSVSRILATRAG